MHRLETYFIKDDEHRKLYEQLKGIGPRLFELAQKSDIEHSFSYESIHLLKSINYHTLTVPKEYGGYGGGLYDMILFQEQLAGYDPAIALAMGWHLGTMLDINEKQVWEKANIEMLNNHVVEKGFLVNRAATEPTSGSPTRGALPTTTVNVVGQHIEVTGQKSYTSLSPVLDLFLVIATLDGQKVEVAIPANTNGVSIVEDWDMVGMRGTASNLLILDGVILPESAIYYRYPKEQVGESVSAQLLHIPACYLGIALAARKEAITFASSYQPPSLDKPIIHTPNVQLHLGEMELALQAARSFIYHTAEQYESETKSIGTLNPSLSSVKIVAMRAALECVDRAMKIVGLKSLAQLHPLQRLYRDVRFGLHNPPMEDAVLFSLGRKAIEDSREY